VKPPQEAAPPEQDNPFAASLDAPTMAEGVPTFLGEMLSRGVGQARLEGPTWDDMTLREPAFDDVTSPGDPRDELPVEAYTHEDGRRAANVDRDHVPTRAIELSEDQALTVPAGVPTPSAPADAHTDATPGGAASEAQAELLTSPEPSKKAQNKPRLDPRELDLEVERMLQAERAFRRGKRALDKGRLEGAIEQFSTAERLCPNEGEFLGALGDALWRQDPKSTRARDLLQRGCERAPQVVALHLSLGTLLEGLGDAAGARIAYERALAANPNEGQAVAGLQRLEG